MYARWLLSLLLLLPSVGIAQVANASFGMASRLTIERGLVENVAIGDADGDGRADLAVTDHADGGQHRLRLYFQNVDRTLSTPAIIPISTDLNDVYSVAAVDLDGDGAKDLVVGALGGINIVRLSAARIPSVTYHQGPSSSCRVIATGDVDGDGKMDIACHGRNEWPNTAVVYYGDGRGGIRNIASVVTSTAYRTELGFKGLQVGDVTGDGHADLVVTAVSDPNFYVIRSDGNGGLLPPVAYPHPASTEAAWPAAVVVTDLDGDNVNEVVFANPEEQPGARLNVYRLGGGGALVLSRQIPINPSTTALLAGDVGGDGDKDLVLGHWSYASISVLGDADAGLETQARYELPGFGDELMYQIRTGSTNALALGDLNNDGCNDLAAATYSGVSISYGCRPYASTLPVSDFDGDGVSDLFWRQGQMGGFMMIWPWASKQAYFECPLPCPPYHGIPPWINQAVGDFDGDGNSDVFYRHTETGENQIVLRAFYPIRRPTVSDLEWQVAGAGDFDGDDRSDLLWRNRSTGGTIIWPAARSQAAVLEMTVSDLNWRVAAIGDFDGDGRSDVFWRHAATGQNYIWWQGRSALPYEVITVADANWRVFGAGDFDGDGRDDLVWRNAASGVGILWLGAQHMSQAGIATVSSQEWQIATIGDYDGDGRSDLLWRNQVSGANLVWRSGDYLQQQEVEPIDPTYAPLK